MVYDQHMLETILTQLRHELLTRAPLDALPPGVWRRTGALNTWGTNAIEGNTLTRKDVERILLEGRSVSNRPLPDGLETIQPFSDGNGRVGRLLLNLHFLKHNWPPVHILPPDRSRYLRSLNAGHTGDLTGLEAFLTSAMGRSLLDLLDQVGTAQDELKPLTKIAARGPYSAKYLGLRAGQERLPAIKIAGDWNTSPRALHLYRQQVGRS